MPTVRTTPVSRPGLTDEQRRAITAREVSVALSAGAGCGKTFVLTERFLAELEPEGTAARPRLNQLVAITFTERAAREMRDRIRSACRQRLLDCDDKHADYWLNLIRELDSARVSTIHSFCGSLLRSHAVEAGLDPRFRVLDGSQTTTLLYELIDDALRNLLADRDEATLSLLTRFSLNALHDMVSRLVAARQDIDWPQWQRETPDTLIARWEAFWRSQTIPLLLRRLVESPNAKTVLHLARRHPPTHAKMRERCDVLLEQVPSLPASKDPAAQLAIIREAAKVQGGGTKKDWASEESFVRFKDAAAGLRKEIDAILKRLAFDPAAARPAAEAALQVLGVAASVDAQYAGKKRELGVLDFNDLLIHARDLLTNPERRDLRRRMASQIRLLLVDEFQDTDPLQVELVKALCDNEYLRGKLFFVGDYKQSIYRFRGADPHVFRQLREQMPVEGQLPLSLNFRSQPAILDFVNALFHDALGDGYEPLHAHRTQVGPTPAIEFLWAINDVPEHGEAQPAAIPAAPESPSAAVDNGDDVGFRERLRRREADWIARRIRVLLDSGEKIVWDSAAAKQGVPAARAVRQGDIALLFRALTNVEYYEEALQRYGIDYYLVGGRAFYGQQEVFDLLNLLRTLESPCDEVSLAGILRSPMFGLHDESLLWLWNHRNSLAGGLFDAELPGELDREQGRRVQFAAETLRSLRAMKDRLPIAELIHEAMRRTGYDAILLTEFLGERKLANLQKLIDRARTFDRVGVFTLSDYITQLAEFVARQPDEALAATHPESTDVVKLMTIHQSKGLEFPVTIVPDIARPRRVMGPGIAFTPQLGPMLKDKNATTGYDFYMLAEAEEEASEIGRLLYVATTRAADYLILANGVEFPEESHRADDALEGAESPFKSSGPWIDLLARQFHLLSGKLKRALPSGYATPEVRVTTTQPAIQSKPVDLRVRRDLLKIVDKAQSMADEGGGKRSHYLAPVSYDPTARRQYSFSRLTGKLHAQTVAAGPELFEAETEAEPRLDPRGLGTLIHAVLAEIDYGSLLPRVPLRRSGGEDGVAVVLPSRGDSATIAPTGGVPLLRRSSGEVGANSLPAEENDVVALVQRHAVEHLPTARPDELGEPVELLQRFLASPRAAAMSAAKEIYAELEFLLPWPPDLPQRDGRYLQGFLDCLYRDAEDQWHVVDYKTNKQVTPERLAKVAADYEMQMLVYGLAAEQILKRPPAELVLCFLRPGLEYSFGWNAAARRRALELVDQALPD